MCFLVDEIVEASDLGACVTGDQVGAYWAILTAMADGVIDFEAGSESKASSALSVSWVISLSSIIFLFLAIPLGASHDLRAIDVSYGISIGFLLAIANLMYFKALSVGPMGVVSAVGGAAVSVPVIYCTFIGKAPSFIDVLGIAAILCGVSLVVYGSKQSVSLSGTHFNSISLAMLAAIMFGASDVLFKLGSSRNVIVLLVLIQVVELLMYSGFMVVQRLRPRLAVNVVAKLTGLGLVNAAGWLAFSAASAGGQIDIASALAYCSPIFTLLLAHFLLKECLNAREVVSFVFVILGAVLLA